MSHSGWLRLQDMSGSKGGRGCNMAHRVLRCMREEDLLKAQTVSMRDVWAKEDKACGTLLGRTYCCLKSEFACSRKHS
jgi:hypothetical protein